MGWYENQFISIASKYIFNGAMLAVADLPIPIHATQGAQLSGRPEFGNEAFDNR